MLTLLLALPKSSCMTAVTVTCDPHSTWPRHVLNPCHSIAERKPKSVLQNFITIKPNSLDRTVFKGNIKINIRGSTWIWVP